MLLKVDNFQLKPSEGTNIKILTTEQMLQTLPIPLAQVNVGNRPEKLRKEIRQIIFSFHRAKEVTKKYITMWWTWYRYNLKWMLYLWIWD